MQLGIVDQHPDRVRCRAPGISTMRLGRWSVHASMAAHKAMFDQVREWAGRYRIRETNIGTAFEQITSEIRNLVDDTTTWIEHSTYEQDEIAGRFHHRLVSIHAFPNGNGRHGRIAADYLVAFLGGKPFTWGVSLDTDTDELRASYLQALHRADGDDISHLLTFARA